MNSGTERKAQGRLKAAIWRYITSMTIVGSCCGIFGALLLRHHYAAAGVMMIAIGWSLRRFDRALTELNQATAAAKELEKESS
jgi:hypothetical protein